MVWTKPLCSVCRRPGHNKTKCPDRRTDPALLAMPLTSEEAAKAFRAFYSIGDYINPLKPELRFLVLKTLCAFYLEERSEPEPCVAQEKK